MKSGFKDGYKLLNQQGFARLMGYYIYGNVCVTICAVVRNLK